jgi:flagella basal body P-ring formation protein FlgA
LLPADAPVRLKAVADKVSLGRAPQVGSLRLFTVTELRQATAEIPMETTEIDIPEQVIVRRLGWPVEAETVRRTLACSNLTHALDFSQATITLPAGFTTAVPDPKLEVGTVSSSPGHLHLMAQMRCRERAVCGSFLAEIVFSVPAVGVRSRELKLASEKVTEPNLSSVTGPVLVQPGSMALLVIDGNGFRITQPVMPLKRAGLGELVRVSDPRTHRSWLAQVSGNGMLRTSGATRKEEAR